MKLDILALVAHPDDAELGCGGTLIKHAREGKKVGVVDLTDGGMGTRGSAAIRKKEAKAASQIMQLSAREHLTFPDGFVLDSRENRLALIKVLRKYRPEIVLTNTPHDRHPDHGMTEKIVPAASFLAGLHKIETHLNDTPQEAHRPKAVYSFIQGYALQPDFIVDISDVWDLKLQALRAFASQFYDPQSTEPATHISTPAFWEWVQARGKEYGFRIGASYGEGFLVRRTLGVRSLFDLC